MARIDLIHRAVQLKLVYAGPSGSGKTTNLLRIQALLPVRVPQLPLLLSAEGTHTLFFDALPLDIGKIRGFTVQLFVYSVPGEQLFVATRSLVISNADALAYVVDSRAEFLEQNATGLVEVERVLQFNQRTSKPIPIMLQYNKRDLAGAAPVPLLQERLNVRHRPYIESVASQGVGVFETLRLLCVEAVRQLQK